MSLIINDSCAIRDLHRRQRQPREGNKRNFLVFVSDELWEDAAFKKWISIIMTQRILHMKVYKCHVLLQKVYQLRAIVTYLKDDLFLRLFHHTKFYKFTEPYLLAQNDQYLLTKLSNLCIGSKSIELLNTIVDCYGYFGDVNMQSMCLIK